jgi:hypothetical protein
VWSTGIYVKTPGHPRADAHGWVKKKAVLVAESMQSVEKRHRIRIVNRNRLDVRPANVFVDSGGERFHFCSACGAAVVRYRSSKTARKFCQKCSHAAGRFNPRWGWTCDFVIGLRMHYARVPCRRVCGQVVGIPLARVARLLSGQTFRNVPIFKGDRHAFIVEAAAYRARIINQEQRGGGLESGKADPRPGWRSLPGGSRWAWPT